jgi:hypothetical protein
MRLIKTFPKSDVALCCRTTLHSGGSSLLCWHLFRFSALKLDVIRSRVIYNRGRLVALSAELTKTELKCGTSIITPPPSPPHQTFNLTSVNTWIVFLSIVTRHHDSCRYLNFIYFIFSGSAAQRGLWLPRSRDFVNTHNDAPHSVGLLLTSNQLVAQTSTWQHTTEKLPCLPVRFEPTISVGERP